jgi:hypothetical protein
LHQRHRDPAGADPELERAAVAREPREEIDGRSEDGGVEPVGRVLFVPGGDAFVEVPVVLVHASNLSDGTIHGVQSEEESLNPFTMQ